MLLKPVSKAAARVLDFITCDLANPCGDGVSSYKIDNSNGFYMPVSVERIGENTYSVAHYIEQNGDLCPDPAMTFLKPPKLDDTWFALSIQQLWDGGQEHYGINLNPDETINTYWERRAKNIRIFTTTWMKNIKDQQDLKIPPKPRAPRIVLDAIQAVAQQDRSRVG